MNLPKISAPSLEPLSLLFENLIGGLDRFVEMPFDNPTREILLEFRSLLTDEKQKCMETLHGEFSKMLQEYEEVTRNYADLEATVFPGINSQLIDLKAALESAANSRPPVPLLEKSEPSPGLILNAGEELKENLLHLRIQGTDLDTRHQRTSGNIWENWKQTGE